MINLTRFWTVPDNPPIDTDCFIVLSYAVESKTIPTKPTRSAIDIVKKILKQFPRAFVIMSTGDNQGLGTSNASVMAGYATSIGIPADSILEESRSKNTVENLIYSRKIMKEHGFRHATIVMYDLHARRTRAILKKMNWSVNWITSSSGGSPAYGWKYFQTNSRFSILIYEVFAYVYNAFRKEL